NALGRVHRGGSSCARVPSPSASGGSPMTQPAFESHPIIHRRSNHRGRLGGRRRAIGGASVAAGALLLLAAPQPLLAQAPRLPAPSVQAPGAVPSGATSVTLITGDRVAVSGDRLQSV